jgi:hypothetical protein
MVQRARLIHPQKGKTKKTPSGSNAKIAWFASPSISISHYLI